MPWVTLWQGLDLDWRYGAGRRVQLVGARLGRVLERLGERKLQSVTRADIDGLADWMLKEGRKRSGKPGTPLSPRSVQLTFARFSRHAMTLSTSG